MRISLNWIKRLLGVPALPVPVAELQSLITLRSTEVENDIERTGPALDGVVVGRVLTCAPHPNADRLRLTTVDIGAAAAVPIVCGAANVAVGQLVAVATIGATLTMPGKDGQPVSVTIKAAKMRGEPSQGMICAEDELGLGPNHDGILVLSGDHRPGTPLSDALGLGDSVLVVDNHGISHRPDLWGHWGWAREIAAILALPAPAEPDTAWQALGSAWSADLRDDGCTAYAGAVIEGVSNTASPRWMQDLLTAAGVRPMGLIVDITNLVMLELGEPMHAFDLRQLSGTRISVRAATAGERFTTLDGRTHQLVAGDLLIADARRALALAGIMGGENSMVQTDTTAVLLEAAIFRPERIRRTRVRTGLATDSSARFEKGLYPELAPAALARACALFAELCPGCRVSARFASGALHQEPRVVPYAWTRVAELVGITVEPAAQREHLARLGIAIDGGRAVIPWWRRKDLHIAEDVVEEVARLHGLERIAAVVPRLPAGTPPANPLRNAEHRARTALSAQGWDEVATYCFTSEAWVARLAWPDTAVIRLANPLSADQSVLRLHLLPNLAEAVARNRKHLGEVALYEIGKRYGAGIGAGDCRDEELVVAGACARAGDETPFSTARDAALATLRGLGYAARAVPCVDVSNDHPHDLPNGLAISRTVHLWVDRTRVGWAGEITADIRAAAGCPERVGAFQLDLERLVSVLGTPKPVPFAEPSRYPVVDRQFSWVCPEALPYGDLAAAMRSAAGALCTGVDLDSIYRGDPIPAGAKSVSVKLWLQAADRTLDERELQKVSERIVTAVGRRYPGVTLRT